MIEWDDDEIEQMDINKRDLEVVINHIERLVKKLEKTDLRLYISPGWVNIMHKDKPSHTGDGTVHQEHIIASVDNQHLIDAGDW